MLYMLMTADVLHQTQSLVLVMKNSKNTVDNFKWVLKLIKTSFYISTNTWYHKFSVY